jgi:hypothetical protein
MSAKHLYERLYCARGQAENHIKSNGGARERASSIIPNAACVPSSQLLLQGVATTI